MIVIKLNKKLITIVIVSLFSFGLFGCDLNNSINPNKIYTENDIKKEFKISLISSTKDCIAIAKDVLSTKDINSDNLSKELPKINKISEKMKKEYNKYQVISKNTDSAKSKELADTSLKTFKHLYDSINSLIESIKNGDSDNYSKASNNFAQGLSKIYDFYNSIK